jgi:ubiquinone/menaquinone biosynthesis C-methylase UbiE
VTVHSPAISSKWDDDLRAQAVRAVAIARELCTCNYPYHVLWPLLRAAGIKGTLRPAEDEVLASFLVPLMADGTRILIAGSADTATLCTIGRMTGERKPEFTVLDRCPAPLKLIQEFAAERQVACRTQLADLTTYAEENHWDIVLVHYTFQFIVPEERFNVLQRLARSLVPGGTLVCVDKEVPRISVADAPDAAEAWFQKAWRRLQAEGLGSALPAALYDQLLHQAAEGRTLRRVTIPSLSHLVEGMRRAGLVLVEEDVVGSTYARGPAVDSSIILAASRPS